MFDWYWVIANFKICIKIQTVLASLELSVKNVKKLSKLGDYNFFPFL